MKKRVFSHRPLVIDFDIKSNDLRMYDGFQSCINNCVRVLECTLFFFFTKCDFNSTFREQKSNSCTAVPNVTLPCDTKEIGVHTKL
jgi:hypothetical protein